jgi:microcystin-dependent protein
MAKNKVSEYSATAANNTDIGGINIAEGCAPSGINNAIRELMAQLKDMQSGTDGDNFTVGGNLTVTGTATGSTPSVSDDSTKFATTAFVRDIIPSGVIVMWSGTIATIPSGWYLCDGNNSTPDLRNKFVIAANADDGGAAKTNITGSATQTGGSKDAIVVSHTHTITDPGHSHTYTAHLNTSASGPISLNDRCPLQTNSTSTATTGISIDSTGSSGTNANLPPYYALAYIMKA